MSDFQILTSSGEGRQPSVRQAPEQSMEIDNFGPHRNQQRQGAMPITNDDGYMKTDHVVFDSQQDTSSRALVQSSLTPLPEVPPDGYQPIDSSRTSPSESLPSHRFSIGSGPLSRGLNAVLPAVSANRAGYSCSNPSNDDVQFGQPTATPPRPTAFAAKAGIPTTATNLHDLRQQWLLTTPVGRPEALLPLRNTGPPPPPPHHLGVSGGVSGATSQPPAAPSAPLSLGNLYSPVAFEQTESPPPAAALLSLFSTEGHQSAVSAVDCCPGVRQSDPLVRGLRHLSLPEHGDMHPPDDGTSMSEIMMIAPSGAAGGTAAAAAGAASAAAPTAAAPTAAAPTAAAPTAAAPTAAAPTAAAPIAAAPIAAAPIAAAAGAATREAASAAGVVAPPVQTLNAAGYGWTVRKVTTMSPAVPRGPLNEVACLQRPESSAEAEALPRRNYRGSGGGGNSNTQCALQHASGGGNSPASVIPASFSAADLSGSVRLSEAEMDVDDPPCRDVEPKSHVCRMDVDSAEATAAGLAAAGGSCGKSNDDLGGGGDGGGGGGGDIDGGGGGGRGGDGGGIGVDGGGGGGHDEDVGALSSRRTAARWTSVDSAFCQTLNLSVADAARALGVSVPELRRRWRQTMTAMAAADAAAAPGEEADMTLAPAGEGEVETEADSAPAAAP